MTQYYGKLNETGAYANIDPWELSPDYVRMDGPPPSGDATAQADGTWLIPVVPDIPIAEAEAFVADFTAKYPSIGWELAKLLGL